MRREKLLQIRLLHTGAIRYVKNITTKDISYSIYGVEALAATQENIAEANRVLSLYPGKAEICL